MPTTPGWPTDVHVLERGWLSSNNILLFDEPRNTAVLVDTGYLSHAEQTLALVEQALGDRRLVSIVNTHLHSDHCGGNAAFQERYGVPIQVPVAEFDTAKAWDETRLSFKVTGQRCARFTPSHALSPGDTIEAGRRRWNVLGAPGHDPHALMLFDAQDGQLIAADALWENGFGVVFPELTGEPGFEEVRATLKLIRSLGARQVIPGHGPAFSDVDAAMDRAEARLDSFERDPLRHAWYAAKVLVKFHLLEVRRLPQAELLQWLGRTPYFSLVYQRHFAQQSWASWTVEVLDALLRSGALRRDGDCIIDA
jgi:glyoxylase-like metal-dependent hydrolase (beta-lactamase superfamily II)